MTTGADIPVWSGLAQGASEFDLIIFDLWGVMHDGIALHRDAETAVLKAREAGVKTVFLSNAPRPRHHVRQHLAAMGLNTDLLDLVVTSGGLARDFVRAHGAGKRLYHLGPGSDHNTIEGLPVDLVDRADAADLILATDLDHHDVEAHAEMLREPAERGVPFLCANPDRVVHVGARLYPCAGAVADLYEAMGGPVHWFGKPTAAALEACVTEVGMTLDTLDRDRVLMVGDSLQTDIAGADGAGFKGMLVASGIHRDALKANMTGNPDHIDGAWFREHVAGDRPVPHVVMRRLTW